MAKITFTADDGSTQDFDVVLPVAVAVAVAPTVAEVDVKESDGSEETFVPETAS